MTAILYESHTLHEYNYTYIKLPTNINCVHEPTFTYNQTEKCIYIYAQSYT